MQSKLFLYMSSPSKNPLDLFFCMQVFTRSMVYTAVAPVASQDNRVNVSIKSCALSISIQTHAHIHSQSKYELWTTHSHRDRTTHTQSRCQSKYELPAATNMQMRVNLFAGQICRLGLNGYWWNFSPLYYLSFSIHYLWSI